MTAISVLLVLLLSSFVQSVTPAFGWLGMAKLPLLLGAVVYYALTHGRPTVVLAAVAGGVAQDSLGFLPLGTSAFFFCLAGLAIHGMRDLLFKDSLLTAAALTAVAGALLALLTGLLLAGGEVEGLPELALPAWAIWLKAGGTALLAPAAALPVCALARGLDRLLGTLGEESA